MILRSIRVRRYKNILDSGEVEMQRDITCLVGKNESGKSALLQALYRLNPVPTGHPEAFVGLRDYPRREYARDRESIAQRCPIAATFELEDEDVRVVEEAWGPRALSSRSVTVARSYDNRLVWELGAERPDPAAFEAGEGPPAEMAAVEAAGETMEADGSSAGDAPSWDERLAALGFDDDAPGSEPAGDGGEAGDLSLSSVGEEGPGRDVRDLLEERLPRFLYFDEYSLMPGRLSVPHACTAGDGLTPGERSALSLIRLAGVDPADLTRDEYEARKASIEAAASDLTGEIFEYWSQNRSLSVEFDVDFRTADADGREGPFIDLRIRNHRHGVTLNFSDRSQGFTWFFSLLAALSALRDSKRLILLLDEPGASLHASAQQDLRRFIDERLIPAHQVVYSTHSAFMVDPKHLDRVRAVEDRDGEGGRVSGAIFDRSSETRIPVEAALGQDLVRSLTAGGAELFVKVPSDHVYLSAMSAHLESLGRTCLDPRWSIVPVGGLAGLSAFAALMDGGARRRAVLFDAPAAGGAAAQSPAGRRLLRSRGIIRVADFVPVRPAVEADAKDEADERDERDERDEELELNEALDASEEFEPPGEPEGLALPESGAPPPDAAPESAGAPADLDFSPFTDSLAAAPEELAADTGALEAGPAGAEPEDRLDGGDGGEAGVPPDGDANEAPAEGALEIEDLFAEDFYLRLVNRSGVATVAPFEVRGSGSIVRRVEAATGLGLDRLLPARLLLGGEDDPLDGLDDPTRERFESLFAAINEVLAE